MRSVIIAGKPTSPGAVIRKGLGRRGYLEIVGNYASSTDDPASFAKTMVDNLETTLTSLSTA